MVVSPRDFLLHSQKLVDTTINPTLNELDCRSAISRAYYSLYHEAKDFLKASGKYKYYQNRIRTKYGKSKWGPHEEVKTILVEIDLKVGLRFNDYKDDRVHADYYLSRAFLSHSVCLSRISGIETLINQIRVLNV